MLQRVWGSKSLSMNNHKISDRKGHRKCASVMSRGDGRSPMGVDIPEGGKLGVTGVEKPEAVSGAVIKRRRCR